MRFFPVIILIIIFSCTQEKVETTDVRIISAPSAIGTKEDPFKRYEFEVMQVVDPKTGRIPKTIHKKEVEFSMKSQDKIALNARRNTLDWTLTGPSNVGGRTRAVALDVLDERVILAGGVSGGMWRSANGGKNWVRASHPATINNATCVAQDISPGQENVWYHGTGELRGNSARIESTPYRGDGIFKSTNGGRTWDLLSSTSFGIYSEFDSPFNYVWNIQIKPSTTGPGEVYAAIYGGIVRSLDGGETWTTVLGADLINSELEDLNESGASFYTNILILPSGKMFATLSTQTAEGDSLVNKGIFRSEDGENWMNISPRELSNPHDRILMSYAPSDEGIVYFWVTENDSNILMKNTNGFWSYYTSVLPSADDDLPVLDTQNSYNMALKVHPEDPDVVFIGGTNLYRTTDGFANKENFKQIGGYDLEETSDPYSGHHPDQHDLFFYPSNPDKMLSANDGGVRLTFDNRAEEVSWSSLNNGFVTSQFYAVALSRVQGSNAVVGGLQDNGSHIKTLSGENVPWNKLLGGDGAFCAATPGDLFWYVSFQEGNVFRLGVSSNQELTSFAQVDPSGGSGYLFINPFILDPNNYNRMYFAGGEVMWRNDNLSQIPSGRQDPTPVNWTKLQSTQLTGAIITSLDVSTLPANVLYYGTAPGLVFRVDDAHQNFLDPVLLHSQPGYVTSISVDPSDASHVMFTYGNYHVQSIFSSNDSGASIEHVGGNLEENEDGTGNGPSVRWCEIIPMSDGSHKYFVGTSSGLFSTTQLDGAATIWVKEGENSVGNAVIRMMDYRSSDGRIVVATHGNGVFESSIPNALEITPESEPVEQLVVRTGFPNPFDSKFKINLTIPEEDRVTIFVVSPTGERIKRLLDAPQFAGEVVAEWDGTNAVGMVMPSGMYFYHILYKGQVCAGKMLFRKQ